MVSPTSLNLCLDDSAQYAGNFKRNTHTRVCVRMHVRARMRMRVHVCMRVCQ